MMDEAEKPTNVGLYGLAPGKNISAPADWSISRDVSRDVGLQEALAKSEERYHSLVETVNDLVWETDDKWIYTFVSHSASEILGRKPEEVVGKALCDLMPLKEANHISRVLASAAASRKPFSLIQSTHLHKDGHPVSMETSGAPFFDDNGNLGGYRGIHRDITQSRDADAQLRQVLRKLERTVDGTVQAITLMAEMRDQNIAGHQRRVADLGRAIADILCLPYEQREIVHIAGLVHDLGKIFIPTEILNKPDKLTEEELAIVRTHPQIGYDVLKKVEFPWSIADIVLQHHERIDGSGYPAGLKGEEILLEARIMAVADVVEAMSSRRSYRSGRQLDSILREMAQNKGVLYDINVTEACLTAFLDKGFKFELEPAATAEG
jgi:PAS domain S-box-containing protein